jgi:hypothetical protein
MPESILKCLLAKVFQRNQRKIGIQMSKVGEYYLVQRWVYTQKQPICFSGTDPKCESWIYTDYQQAVTKTSMLVDLARKEFAQWN